MSLTTDLEASLASGDWEPTGETLEQIVKRDLTARSIPTQTSNVAAVAAPDIAGAGLADFLGFVMARRDKALNVMARGGAGFAEAFDTLIESDAVTSAFHKFEMARISGI